MQGQSIFYVVFGGVMRRLFFYKLFITMKNKSLAFDISGLFEQNEHVFGLSWLEIGTYLAVPEYTKQPKLTAEATCTNN